MQKSIDRYKIIMKLGEGSYGVVYKAKDTQTGEFVAIKNCKIEKDDDGIPSTTLREISILKEIKHKNIINLLDVIYKPINMELHLIFEYMDQDLRNFYRKKIPSNQYLPVYTVKSILNQILQGTKHCHQRLVMHRDLKPDNILISNKGIVKIADFGLATPFQCQNRELTKEIETLWYRPPEIILGQKNYSLPVDIWTIGCIFAELLQKKPLFQGDCEIGQLFEIFELLGTPDEDIWRDYKDLPYAKKSFPRFKKQSLKERVPRIDDNGLDLLKKMLMMDPKQRISAVKALNHSYFEDIDKEFY